MTWLQTASGHAVDFLSPDPSQITAEDITTSLSRLPRFNGHTLPNKPWTVAQHSLLVEALLSPQTNKELQLAALLHDAHEAYTGDITSPLQHAITYLNSDYNPIRDIQDSLDRAIATTFKFSPMLFCCPEIVRADFRALALEKTFLMAPEPKPWSQALPTFPHEATATLNQITTSTSRSMDGGASAFLTRLAQLQA